MKPLKRWGLRNVFDPSFYFSVLKISFFHFHGPFNFWYSWYIRESERERERERDRKETFSGHWKRGEHLHQNGMKCNKIIDSTQVTSRDRDEDERKRKWDPHTKRRNKLFTFAPFFVNILLSFFSWNKIGFLRLPFFSKKTFSAPSLKDGKKMESTFPLPSVSGSLERLSSSIQEKGNQVLKQREEHLLSENEQQQNYNLWGRDVFKSVWHVISASTSSSVTSTR